MLRALDKRGDRVLADDVDRGVEAFCPECGEGLIFKKGPWVVAHFAHHADTGCAYGEGESMRHLEMKRQIRSMADGVFVDYEVPLLPDRRADVVLKGRVVVECQASSIGTAEWEQRTRSYNGLGYRVLWIWDLTRLVGTPRWTTGSQDEKRIPAEIRWCHRVAYGRLYALDAGGELWACRLEKVTPRENDWDEGPAFRYPKTLRHVEPHSLPETTTLTPYTGVDGLKLVNLGEGVWWRP